MSNYSYFARLGIGFDQFFNSILGGSPDETFSARCWRLRLKQPWKALRAGIDLIFFWQRNHCQTAWQSEIERAQLPQCYRVAKEG